MQASQLGVYKAFVDNYKVALETAEKCSQANSQFQKISEVSSSSSYSEEPEERVGWCQTQWFNDKSFYVNLVSIVDVFFF